MWPLAVEDVPHPQDEPLPDREFVEFDCECFVCRVCSSGVVVPFRVDGERVGACREQRCGDGDVEGGVVGELVDGPVLVDVE